MLASVAMLYIMAATSQAQTSGEITGLVTDSSGAAVTGAVVTVTNKATGATRQISTNSEGLYSFPSLLPGVYELKVEQAGFKTSRLDNITLEVQQTARLDVKMEVGAVGESVTISSVGALLNAENATVGTVI
jgi:protocatechuate 3,4-dioxygenase beta subunit